MDGNVETDLHEAEFGAEIKGNPECFPDFRAGAKYWQRFSWELLILKNSTTHEKPEAGAAMEVPLR
jgi:hypothetical protein